MLRVEYYVYGDKDEEVNNVEVEAYEIKDPRITTMNQAAAYVSSVIYGTNGTAPLSLKEFNASVDAKLFPHPRTEDPKKLLSYLERDEFELTQLEVKNVMEHEINNTSVVVAKMFLNTNELNRYSRRNSFLLIHVKGGTVTANNTPTEIGETIHIASITNAADVMKGWYEDAMKDYPGQLPPDSTIEIGAPIIAMKINMNNEGAILPIPNISFDATVPVLK